MSFLEFFKNADSSLWRGLDLSQSDGALRSAYQRSSFNVIKFFVRQYFEFQRFKDVDVEKLSENIKSKLGNHGPE